MRRLFGGALALLIAVTCAPHKDPCTGVKCPFNQFCDHSGRCELECGKVDAGTNAPGTIASRAFRRGNRAPDGRCQRPPPGARNTCTS
jgi:hypothetical protein